MSTLHTLEERMNALFGELVNRPTTDELVASGALVEATGLYAAGNDSDPEQQPRVLFSSDAWAFPPFVTRRSPWPKRPQSSA